MASPASHGEQLDSPTVLSTQKSYSEEVAAECLRNRAYGLSTAGLPLKLFCEQQGILAAMKIQHDIAVAQHSRPAQGNGIALPR
jgi:hypothetical protein